MAVISKILLNCNGFHLEEFLSEFHFANPIGAKYFIQRGEFPTTCSRFRYQKNKLEKKLI